MIRIISYGIVFFLWLTFIRALFRVIRISRRKRAYPYGAYSYKYDPTILEKANNAENDLLFQHYKTNIPKGSLKKHIDSDLQDIEINILENRG